LTLSTGAGVDLRDIGARERSNAESDSCLEGIPGNLWDLITEEEWGTFVPRGEVKSTKENGFGKSSKKKLWC
jgi:hypothetical protein